MDHLARKNDPSSVGAEMVKEYTTAIHATIPKLLGALAVVRSLSRELYDSLFPLAEDLFKLDAGVARALIGLRNQGDASDAVERVASFAEQSAALYKTLPNELAKAMRAAGVHDWETLTRE